MKARLQAYKGIWSKLLVGLVMGVAVGVLGLAYLISGEIYDYRDSVDGLHLPQVDAVVVLAGGRGRIITAGDVWGRYWELAQRWPLGPGIKPSPKVPVLYFSGVGPHINWPIVAPQLRSGVREVIKADDVVVENESQNTEENAEYLQRIAAKKGWGKILLLTSRYHMRRARFIFERVFERTNTPIEIETLSVFQDPFEPGEWRESFQGVRVTISEYFKWIYYTRVWGR